MMNPLASAQSGSGNTRAIGRFDRTGGSRARRKNASERGVFAGLSSPAEFRYGARRHPLLCQNQLQV